MKINKLSSSLVAFSILSTYAVANETEQIKELKQEIQELREITQTLVDETSDLKTGFNYTTVDTTKQHSGLSNAASKVYYSKSPLSIGGYGEMYYAHTSNENSANSSVVDVYRFVPYIGYKFSDNVILNVELEFEHGGVEPDAGGEVIVEFMYLDFLMNDNLNIRLGHMLTPMGLINEKHEPTLFTTVQRPTTSKNLIPSTWHESGLMVYGDIVENLSYKVAGLTALKPDDNGDKWIRNGRGGSFKNTDPKLSLTTRLDYTGINGLLVGASVYKDSDITMIDTHVDLNLNAFRAYGVYTQTNRSDTTIGQVEKAQGGFINLGYDLSSLTSSQSKMPIFIQYENIDVQSEITDGVPTNATNTTTVGVNFFPHEQVVLKADYAMQTQTGADDKNIASVSIGFIF